MELLDGSFPQPEIESPYYKTWVKVDYMVSSWIINSISNELVGAFVHIDSTEKLWAALNHRFNRSNGPKIARLQREISSYMQGNQSILVYFNNLTALWNELDMILPPLNCMCGARNVAVKREENQKLMQFLNGLNDGYESVRSQVLFLDPLPSVDRAYSMILQVEDQRMTNDTAMDSYGQVAMNVGQQFPSKSNNSYGKQYNFKGKKTKEEKMLLYCPHCNRDGHEEKDCFKLHGFPDWYKKLKETNGKMKANFVETSLQNDKHERRSDNPKQNSEIGKVIQTEFAKYMGQWMNNTGATSSSQKNDVNMIHNGTISQQEFTGHYAFSILGRMAKEKWFVDSGASAHICCNPDLMTNVTELMKSQDIFLQDGIVKQITHLGMVEINADITLQNVLLAPDFTHNLISVVQLAKDSMARCLFLNTHCVIQRIGSDHIMGMGKLIGNLYVIDEPVSYTILNASTSSMQESHNMLGHPSAGVMEHITSLKPRMSSNFLTALKSCEVCIQSKQSRLPFPTLHRRTSALFELVHIDVWGPCTDSCNDNVRFMLTLVEDFSRMTWIYLLNNKGQVYSVLKQYILMIKTQFGSIMKQIRTDNGTEFVNKNVTGLFAEFGIIHQKSCVYSPQQNGIVERRHRSLLQIGRALMFDSKLPPKLWPYSLLTATWLLNRMPSKVLGWKCPYSVLFEEEPSLDMVHPFDCLAYAVNLYPYKTKFVIN